MTNGAARTGTQDENRPPHTSRTTKHPDERKDEILAAARALFAEQGIARTSISDVAERVGITRGLVYHYFTDKDTLVDMVLEQHIDEFVSSIREWDAQREVGNIEQALADCITMFRGHVRSAANPVGGLPRIEDARLYNRFIDRAVGAMVDCFRTTTVEAYARLHRIEIENVYETFFVLIYGLIGLTRSHPTTSDERLTDIVRQTLRLDMGGDDGSPT